MKNILVTGGAGFIGSNFIHYLFNNLPDTKIYNLDALTYAGNPQNLKDIDKSPRYHFYHADICDSTALEKIFINHSFDTIVHFAAESHVDRSIQDPLIFVQTNVVGTANLLRFSRENWEKKRGVTADNFRFIHVSTDEVFGSLTSDEPAFTETTPYSPNSPYAASKAAGDHLAYSYHQTYGFPVIITNCSNNYGPYQFPEKLIPLIILNAVSGKKLPVYGDGKQIRDWLYVEDHCEALFSLIENGTPGETYNIGGNNQPTNLEVILSLCRIFDQLLPKSKFLPHEELIQFVKDRPGHDRRYAMNITKIRDEIGWQPKTSFNEGLGKTVKWYLENNAWVKKVIQKPSYDEWIHANYLIRGA